MHKASSGKLQRPFLVLLEDLEGYWGVGVGMILRHSWHADGPMSESLEECSSFDSSNPVASMVSCSYLAYLSYSCVVTVKRPVGFDTLFRTHESMFQTPSRP